MMLFDKLYIYTEDIKDKETSTKGIWNKIYSKT